MDFWICKKPLLTGIAILAISSFSLSFTSAMKTQDNDYRPLYLCDICEVGYVIQFTDIEEVFSFNEDCKCQRIQNQEVYNHAYYTSKVISGYRCTFCGIIEASQSTSPLWYKHTFKDN